LKANGHIIQKMLVDLKVSRKVNTLQLQQRLEQLVEDRLLPRLESLFDRLVGPDMWVEFERIEVDLGHVTGRLTDEEWVDNLFTNLKQYFEQEIQRRSSSSNANGAVSPGHGTEQLTDGEGVDNLAISLKQFFGQEIHHRSSSSNANGAVRQEMLAYFLDHGSLPWWAVEVSLADYVTSRIPEQAEYIWGLLKEPTRRRRWVLQFDSLIQKALFEALGIELPVQLEEWLTFSKPLDTCKTREIYWEVCWELSLEAEKSPKIWWHKLIQRLLSSIGNSRQREDFHRKAQKALFEASGIELPVQLEEWLTFSKPLDTRKAREIYWEVCWELFFEQEKSPEDWWCNLIMLSQRKDQQDLNPEIAPDVSSFVKTKSSIDSEDIYVPLAGIVLVHPFLPAFFNRVGLTREEAFSDPDAQERAVHVLYFIATRQEHPNEQDLSVLKLLCGWELQAPIAKYIDLTANEKEQAEGMLQALIGQWSALEGSTTEELRGSFFIREGKLKTADLGWHLTVETKSYDVLMNTLSWGLSPIQYPWMEKMLWVDWA
jgi:hypothetical protein